MSNTLPTKGLPAMTFASAWCHRRCWATVSAYAMTSVSENTMRRRSLAAPGAGCSSKVELRDLNWAPLSESSLLHKSADEEPQAVSSPSSSQSLLPLFSASMVPLPHPRSRPSPASALPLVPLLVARVLVLVPLLCMLMWDLSRGGVALAVVGTDCGEVGGDGAGAGSGAGAAAAPPSPSSVLCFHPRSSAPLAVRSAVFPVPVRALGVTAPLPPPPLLRRLLLLLLLLRRR